MPAERAAGNPNFYDLVQQQAALLSRRGWRRSIELPDCQAIQGMIAVLDVGAGTDWCSFEVERRGGQVLAVEARRTIGARAKRPGERLSGRPVDSPGGCVYSAG
jgi:hypothetical protein